MATATERIPIPLQLAAPRAPVSLIARKEILDNLLSLKFYVCLITMAALVGLSAFVMYRDYELRMQNYNVLRERAKPRPGESGLMAVVPPRPLSVFAKGLEEIMDTTFSLSTMRHKYSAS